MKNKKTLPISEYQKRFFIEWALAPEDNTYNLSFVYKINGKLNKIILKQVCELFIKEHDICHAKYSADGSICYYENYAIKDFFHEDKLDPNKNINLQLRELLDKPFDLTHDVLLQFILLDNNQVSGEYYLVMHVNHIICDANSAAMCVHGLSKNYNALIMNKYHAVGIDQTFVGAVKAEQQILTAEYKLNAKEYWLNFIADLSLNVQLPYKSKINSQPTSNKSINKRGEFIYFNFNANETKQLKEFAKKNRSTLFIVLSALYGVIISKYTNQSKLLLSYPINMRPRGYLEVTGCFVNNVPLKIDLEQSNTLDELITNLTLQRKETKSYQRYLLTDIIEDQRKYNKIEVDVLFNVGFSQTNLNAVELVLSGLEVEAVDFPWSHTMAYELNLLYDDSAGDMIKFILGYKEALFDRDLIKAFKNSFQDLVSRVINNEVIYCRTYCVLDKATYNQVIYEYNSINKKIYSQNKTIHQLFEEQVKKTPNNIAVVYGDKQLTYKELNQRSNQLANYLREEYEIKGDDLIVLCLGRSEYILIAIFGVLKSGAAYVPIDPEYPEERINYILEDTRPKLLITTDDYGGIFGGGEDMVYKISDIEILLIDHPKFSEVQKNYSKIAPGLNVTSNNLVYIIYTSGTTGKPKGVMISHKNLVNYVQSIIHAYGVGKEEKGVLVSEYVFDLGNTTIYPLLLAGAELHIISKDNSMSYDYMINYVKTRKINWIKSTPLYFESVFLGAKQNNKNELLLFKKIIFGGESSSWDLINYLESQQKVKVFNHYGPTETTVGCFTNLAFSQSGINVIGKPITNYAAYILDGNLNPLPVGSIGELYVGGAGVACGYLNLPKLTNERFLANPFQTKSEKLSNINDRIYKTGDLVRMLPDGNIEYIGRIDSQIKIRGYRIELREIENRLLKHKNIVSAVVLVKTVVTVKQLIAYLVPGQIIPSIAEIKDFLVEALPDYMIPGQYVMLKQLPLTLNGKLDHAALPNPEFINNVSEYIPPRDELDKSLIHIFSNILNIEESKLSIRADFFSLGGNSILTIKLANEINKHIANSKITIADIFKYKNVEKLSNHIIHSSGDKTTNEIKIGKYNLSNPEEYKLSFAQERLWFIDNLEQGTNAYTIPIILKLSDDLNEEYLFRALDDIVNRHEILRTVIKQDANANAYQEVLEPIWCPLIYRHVYSSTDDLHRDLENNYNYVFSLDSGYPMKIDYYEKIKPARKKITNLNKDADRFLSIVIHHIAFDGWSVDILLNELSILYQYYNELATDVHTLLTFAPLRIQYKDYALWQRDYLSGEILDKQLAYWKNQLSGYENLHLMTDKPRPLDIDYAGANVYFKLDKQISNDLRFLSKNLGISLYSILLGGYYLLLSAYSNQTDIVIGTPVANRHYSDLENLIGFFVNTLALRYEIDTKRTVFEYLVNVGNKVMDAQIHQDLPFEKLVDYLNIEKDTSRHPIFQVMFGLRSFGRKVTGFKTKSDTKNQLFEIYNPKSYMVAKFDLSTIIDDSGLELIGYINYRTSLYNNATVENLVKTYRIILENIANSNKKTRLNQMKLLDKKDYYTFTVQYNQTEKSYSHNKMIHQLFEEQVKKTPNEIAVKYEDIQYTYIELNVRANQVASYLRKTYDIKGDDLIALCLYRNEYLLIAILGVLKAGGAYVPVDPNYPTDRIDFILNDTKVKVLIINEQNAFLQDCRGDSSPNVLAIDSNKFNQVLKEYSKTNLTLNVSSNNLVYVMYTSGTTGNPKGVMIEQHQLSGFIQSFIKQVFNDNDKKFNCLSTTNYVFDIFGLEYIVPLIHGSYVELVNLDKFLNLSCKIDINKYDYIQLTPSKVSLCFEQVHNNKPEIKKNITILIGGEALNLSEINLIRRYEKKNQNIKFSIVNVYGPTETTIWSTYDVLDKRDNITIGKPLPNEKIYILNSSLSPLPIGAVGELYVGGAGIARGYLNQPELTKERFLPNPFQTDAERLSGTNNRIYKTGDLVRMLPGGNIEYIGRNDSQVKIRGFRVELGEIEAQLSKWMGVKQSVVLALEHFDKKGNLAGGKYLVAYYVADNQLDEVSILNYLGRELPDYMVPGVLVHIDKLPLTINGKLDRKALPNPEFDSKSIYLAPRNNLEEKICEVYAVVLGRPCDRFSIKDDFFRLGGNSMLSIQVSSRLRKVGINCAVKDIFTYRTIESLAYYLSQNNLAIMGIKNEQGLLDKGLYSQIHHDEIQYWKFILESLPDYKTLKTYNSTISQFRLSKQITRQLQQQANQTYNTDVNDLLLTALAYALKDWDSFNLHGITLERSSRELIASGINHGNTAGCFMYPVKLLLQDTIGESIKYIKESLRLIPNKGIGYSRFSVLENSSISFSQLPPITFNYLEQFGNVATPKKWQMMTETVDVSIGSATLDHSLVNINGGVCKGQLLFNITTRLGKKSTELIAKKFEYYLEDVIAHCIKAFESNNKENTPSDFHDFLPFEVFNENIEENPLFILPPGEGGAESYYNNLVPILSDKKLVLFNNFYLFLQQHEVKHKLTFEELARYYILQLQIIQPRGPYELLGWSFGGVLAFEMARQLKISGERVKRIVLFDSFFRLKEVISHIPIGVASQHTYDSIGYSYDPVINDNLFEGTEIILFKAKNEVGGVFLKKLPEKFGKSPDINNIRKLFFKYYTKTKSNNLDYYIDHFRLHEVECHHYNIMDHILERLKNIFCK